MGIKQARQLRKNMTDTERFVWGRLRSRRFAGYKFRRQMPIGRYIVDFVCLQKRLVLELDGGQHAERKQYDEQRTLWLQTQGFEVLRFWDHEALQEWEAVEEVIWRRLQSGLPASKPNQIVDPGRGESQRR